MGDIFDALDNLDNEDDFFSEEMEQKPPTLQTGERKTSLPSPGTRLSKVRITTNNKDFILLVKQEYALSGERLTFPEVVEKIVNHWKQTKNPLDENQGA